MPDLTLIIKGLAGTTEARRIERLLIRHSSVNEAYADVEKGLIAISYDGGEGEFEKIGQTLEAAGLEFERSPGSERAGT